MSRLRRLALVVAVAGTAIAVFAAGFSRGSRTRGPAIDQALAALEKAASVDVRLAADGTVVQISGGAIEAHAAADAELFRYVLLLRPELSPPTLELMKCSGLQAIVLCRDLAFNGQRRAAVPAFGPRTLYLDVERGGHDSLYQRMTFHHEFFHYIDYRDDGVVYGDLAWQTLNDPRFKYGDGGVNVQDDSSYSHVAGAPRGFPSLYATTGVEEDKAEIYAYLMVDSAALRDVAARDSVLRAKIEHMKLLIGDFCPSAAQQPPFRDSR